MKLIDLCEVLPENAYFVVRDKTGVIFSGTQLYDCFADVMYKQVVLVDVYPKISPFVHGFEIEVK